MRRDGRAALHLMAALIALLLIGWGLGALVRATTQTVDLSAVRDLAADRTPFLTTAARALSVIGSGYVMLPLALLCSVVLYAFRRAAAGASVGLSVVGTVVISNTDKVLVGRPRPPIHHLVHVSSASFPSGHTSQTTAVCLGLLLVFLASRRRRLATAVSACLAALVIAAVAFSRVYLGVHYPTDVAAGGLLAGAWTGAVAWVLLRSTPPALAAPGR